MYSVFLTQENEVISCVLVKHPPQKETI